jgi:hypothetical protein
METKKRKKVVNGLVYLVVLVLIGVIVYQNQKISKLSHLLNSASEASEKLMSGQDNMIQNDLSQVPPPVAMGNAQAGYDDLRYQLDAAEEELDMARDQIARNDESPMSMGFQTPDEMLKTSEGRKTLRSALKNGYDHSYGSLFEEMNLSPEKIEQVKEMMADHQMTGMELLARAQDASLTEEERLNLRKQLEELPAQNDTEFAAMLGEENFETYTDYKDRSQERSMIQMLSQNLSFDDTLTGDQKKSLLESMYNNRQDTYSQQNYDPGDVDITDPDDEGIAKFMEMNVLVYDGYIKGVEEAGLSESQEKQLKKYLEKEQAMMKSRMELQTRVASGELDQEEAREEMESGNIIIMEF